MNAYGLKRKELRVIDLRTTYCQSRPNKPIFHLFERGNTRMVGSPHVQFAEYYFSKGENWLRRNWKSTRYYKFRNFIGKKGFPSRFVGLCKSVSNGYLRKEHAGEFITILDEPFSYTRFNRKVDLDLAPEVWSGHHRVGILIALEKYEAKVEVAMDKYPGSCKSYGKIHDLCIAGA